VLILPIHEARAGAKLAMSVMHPKQRDQELLKAGFVLDDPIIGRLKSMEVQQVFVEFPGLDDLDKYVAASFPPERRALFQQAKNVIGANEKSTQPVVRYSDYLDATRELIKSILSNPFAVMLDVLSTGTDEVAHATGVAHLAVVLGLKLDAYLIKERPRLSPTHAKDVGALGVAAMLHDLGKTKLPPELRKFTSINPPANETDRQAWEKHTQLGYDIIHGGIDAATAAAVLHHHQRFDGTGFPQLKRPDGSTLHFSGGQIHVFARIIGAADLFERLAVAPDGKRRPNYQVLHWIQHSFAGWIDPEIFGVMPQVIPPFSPGRAVRLSDGTEALVTGFQPFSPYQPLVKRFDRQTQKLQDETIDLRTGTLKIEALDGAMLSELEAFPLGSEKPLPA